MSAAGRSQPPAPPHSEGPRPQLVARAFAGLSGRELHDLMRLRVDVFVVEQRCVYPELDGHDLEATHLLAKLGEELVAYCRWYPDREAVVLGRIVVRADHRGRSLGRALVEKAARLIGDRRIRISAQQPLEAYYRRLGFTTVSSPYDDFGIPHVDMVRDPETR